MSDEKVTKEKTIEHPMETVLDIPQGTTIVEYKESLPAELVKHQEYDEKDVEIEEQFQEVYSKAMDAFDDQQEVTETVEGKYVARNAEVAVQFLNAALNAAKEKSNLKMHKDKLGTATGENGKGPHTVNNNLIVDRNDLLKAVLEGGPPQQGVSTNEPIDVTPEEK